MCKITRNNKRQELLNEVIEGRVKGSVWNVVQSSREFWKVGSVWKHMKAYKGTGIKLLSSGANISAQIISTGPSPPQRALAFLNVPWPSLTCPSLPPCAPAILHVPRLSSMHPGHPPCAPAVLNTPWPSSMHPGHPQCTPALLNMPWPSSTSHSQWLLCDNDFCLICNIAAFSQKVTTQAASKCWSASLHMWSCSLPSG